MIGFDLTPEQKALQEKARRFSEQVILPVAAEHDRDGTFPLDVMEKAHREGFFTPLVPKKYGGQGLGVLDTCILSEESLNLGQKNRRSNFSSLSVQSLALLPTV
jgi:acyl-CoA dehydrogenase